MVQAYSYSILVLIVHLLGSVSALTGLREVEIGDISTVSGWLYFIDDHVGEVRRIRLDGSKLEVVADLEYKPSPNHNRVLIEPSEDGEIASVAFHDLTGETRLVMKKVGAAKQAAPVELRDDKGVAIYGNVTFGPYSTRRFVKAPHVRTGFWAREGLTINGNCYALETPFMAEVWRNLVVLPDGKVIAQFGEAVFLIDHERGKVAHLVHGTGGDVLIDLEEP